MGSGDWPDGSRLREERRRILSLLSCSEPENLSEQMCSHGDGEAMFTSQEVSAIPKAGLRANYLKHRGTKPLLDVEYIYCDRFELALLLGKPNSFFVDRSYGFKRWQQPSIHSHQSRPLYPRTSLEGTCTAAPSGIPRCLCKPSGSSHLTLTICLPPWCCEPPQTAQPTESPWADWTSSLQVIMHCSSPCDNPCTSRMLLCPRLNVRVASSRALIV